MTELIPGLIKVLGRYTLTLMITSYGLVLLTTLVFRTLNHTLKSYPLRSVFLLVFPVAIANLIIMLFFILPKEQNLMFICFLSAISIALIYRIFSSVIVKNNHLTWPLSATIGVTITILTYILMKIIVTIAVSSMF